MNLFVALNAYAEVTISIVDQHNKPVSDAVVFVNNSEIVRAKSYPVAVMDQVNRQFLPRVLIINKGQDVTFPNSDNTRHHVYSFSNPNNFEIKLYSQKTTDLVRFNHAGIVILGCNIHDRMKGYIFVADNGSAVLSNEQGLATLPINKPKRVSLWHERLSSDAATTKSYELIDQDASGAWSLKLNLKPVARKIKKSFKSRFK